MDANAPSGRDDSETVALIISAERLKWRTRIKYQPRVFKSKSAGIVLLWSFALQTVVYGFTYYAVPFDPAQRNGSSAAIEETVITSSIDMPYIASAAASIFYPLAGIVADVYLGRYKVIIYSVLLTLILGVVTIFFLPVKILGANEEWEPYIVVTVCIILVVSESPFLANAVQFGTDQLLDSPSEELSSFAHWYVWIHLLAQALPLLFVANNQTVFTGVYSVIFLIICGLSLSFVFIKKTSDWFVKIRPDQVSPYTAFFRVLNFARKHKVPVRRSAFTYWEDELPPRMDFGKEKYGGPFSSEEVEDIKTVLRILGVLMALAPLFIAELSVLPQKMLLQHLGFESFKSGQSYSLRYFVTVLFALVPNTFGLLFVPLHELVLFPLFQKRLPSMLNNLWLGALAFTVSFVSSLLIDAVGHYSDGHWTCMFTSSGKTLHIDPLVLSIPALFSGLGNMVVTISALEFILAQAPHHFKGMLIGLLYCIRGVFDSYAYVMVISFAKSFPGPGISCCFGYYLMNSMLAFLTLGILYLAIVRYKSRKREDVVNEYQFAEAYYSRQPRAVCNS